MKKQYYTDENIEIRQTVNGFIVHAGFDNCSPKGSNNTLVFQSKAELHKFIDEHFTFENVSEIKNDKK